MGRMPDEDIAGLKVISLETPTRHFFAVFEVFVVYFYGDILDRMGVRRGSHPHSVLR
jgi:hypothetical protein